MGQISELAKNNKIECRHRLYLRLFSLRGSVNFKKKTAKNLSKTFYDKINQQTEIIQNAANNCSVYKLIE